VDQPSSLASHPDTHAFEPVHRFNRRVFVMTSLASGFAAAVLPVAATTIATPATGLTVGETKIPTKDGQIPAFYAHPDKGDKFPTVLVVQEIFGVHEHIKDICRRFAKAGYLAIAPEMYARQGDATKYTDIQQLVREVVSKVPDAQVMSDLDAAAAWAEKSGKGDPKRLAVTGFCWGGRITWLYTAHNPNVKAGGAWYGRIVGMPNDLQPKHPIDVAGQIKHRVLGLYGAADTGIPNDTVEKMREALKAVNDRSQIILYPDTPHGFYADYRPSYRKDKADDAWVKLLAFFKQQGV
jgi:carboxymethylenebutenolidase